MIFPLILPYMIMRSYLILRKIIGPTSAKHRSTNDWYYVVNRIIMYTLK